MPVGMSCSWNCKDYAPLVKKRGSYYHQYCNTYFNKLNRYKIITNKSTVKSSVLSQII